MNCWIIVPSWCWFWYILYEVTVNSSLDDSSIIVSIKKTGMINRKDRDTPTLSVCVALLLLCCCCTTIKYVRLKVKLRKLIVNLRLSNTSLFNFKEKKEVAIWTIMKVTNYSTYYTTTLLYVLMSIIPLLWFLRNAQPVVSAPLKFLSCCCCCRWRIGDGVKY